MVPPLTIGIFTETFGGYYFGSIIQGIHKAAREHGARVIAIEGRPIDVNAPSFAWDHVDGWILVHWIDGIEAIARKGKPIVTTSHLALELGCPAVKFDNRGGSYKATAHLIEHGHTRIAFTAPLELKGTFSDDMQQRLAGYEAALADHSLSLDPNLVIRIGPDHPAHSFFEPGGRDAAQYLLDRGLPCTAVVCAVDMVALGVMERLQVAGVRVPEDMAITGFDDLEQAQRASPPLTSVSIQFDVLGSTATRILLAQLTGKDVPAEITYTSSALIRRRSCGCDTSEIRGLLAGDVANPGTDLARQLVNTVRYPDVADAATLPTQSWPGVTVLVDGIDAAVTGAPLPAGADLYQAWLEAAAVAKNTEVLHRAFTLIQRVAEQRIATAPDPAAARAAVTTLLSQALFQLLRAIENNAMSLISNLDRLVQTNYAISLQLLDSTSSLAADLSWLDKTTARWGCLGLWSDSEAGPGSDLVVAGSFSRADDLAVPLRNHYPVTAFPPIEFLPESTLGGTDAIKLIPVRTARRDWGVLAICAPMENWLFQASENASMWAAQLGAALERAALLDSLIEQQEDLRRGYEREQLLASMVRELGSPVIPLLPGVLLIPLVGAIDPARAQQFIESMLTGVTEHQAEIVLIDISAVPLVDTHVAATLIQATQATTLLGARVILVGIRPEIAQSIVGLGIDLQGVTTLPTLAAAVTTLMRRQVR
jgi:DNA-binding LacI/PurR family transcriptional regulator/anti-anti-sigma regulatory factor